MAYRTGERIQPQLFPECIDDYVSKEAPVRADDALIDAMNLSSLGMEWNPNKVGCPQYEPKIMLKLLVYGYSYGVRSSRKLEREAHDNLSFIWWLGGLKPDHKTIAEFRRRNRGALKKVLRDCARICLRLGLIEGNTWFVDGSKFRANAAIDQSWTPKKCQETVARIEEILLECETVDQEESGTNSLGQMRAEWADQKILKVQIQSMQRTLEEEGKTSRNRTDPDWVRVHGRQGSHAGYNRQIGVDEKHGLIVASEVVNQNNDLGQLGAVVEKAQENLERPYPTVCADAGYTDYNDVQRVEAQGMEVIVPSRKQAHNQPVSLFDKSHFEYDAERDAYRCPEGHWLEYRRTRRGREREYQAKKRICCRCRHFGECTTAQSGGRQITRYVSTKSTASEWRRGMNRPRGSRFIRSEKRKWNYRLVI